MTRPAAKVTQAEVEMAEGYRDGRNPDCPPPSDNRSASYRHGFLNGRAEIETRNPRAPANVLRKWAEEAIAEDEARGRE
jgi:hypothetical protein